jgi:hypothetical protein
MHSTHNCSGEAGAVTLKYVSQFRVLLACLKWYEIQVGDGEQVYSKCVIGAFIAGVAANIGGHHGGVLVVGKR